MVIPANLKLVREALDEFDEAHRERGEIDIQRIIV